MAEQHRQNHKSGKPSREAKGANRTLGRDTEELAIDYPDSKCPDSPTAAHWYVRLTGSKIWVCKYCWTPVWLPSDFNDAVDFSINIKTYGLQTAYKRRLARMPKVREAIGFLLAMRQFKSDSNFNKEDIMATAHSIASAGGFVDKSDTVGDMILKAKIDFRNMKGGLVYG